MPSVLVTETAKEDLVNLIEAHSLPQDTSERVSRRLRPLERFPSMGSPLEGRWAGARFLLGPWTWMLIVYEYGEGLDEYGESLDAVVVTTIQDARSADSATTSP